MTVPANSSANGPDSGGPDSNHADSWSSRIESRYHCVLEKDLADWFDSELWRQNFACPAGRFCEPVSAEELLSPAPSTIWPGLMPCDCLPLLGNGLGDWLCLRLAVDHGTDAAGNMLVHWYHGGGDWIPWSSHGKDQVPLAQAVLFDAVRQDLPGGDREHAIPADHPDAHLETDADPLLDWANQWLTSSGVEIPLSKGSGTGPQIAAAMIEQDVAQVAVRCQLVMDALDNPAITAEVRSQWPAKHARIEQSLFDNALIDRSWWPKNGPPDARTLDQQDWDAVLEHCQAVSRIAPEIAWAWDVMGYAYERLGELDEAVRCYTQGLRCSIFTDQTVRVRTHGFTGDSEKFSASRLMHLDREPDQDELHAYFQILKQPSADRRRLDVTEHFSQRAQAPADQLGDQRDPYSDWVRAGWDLGAETMKAFPTLLDHITASAQAAGRHAQAAIAATHRECFRQRYHL